MYGSVFLCVYIADFALFGISNIEEVFFTSFFCLFLRLSLLGETLGVTVRGYNIKS